MMDPLRLRPKKKADEQQQKQQEQQRVGAEIESKSTIPARQGEEAEGDKIDTLIGYRAPAFFRGKASFLVGIGKKLHEDEVLK
jgi:hypothetical protein